MYIENIGKGGGEFNGVDAVFHGGGAGDTTFGGGDVGDDPLHGPVPGGVPTQGILANHC